MPKFYRKLNTKTELIGQRFGRLVVLGPGPSTTKWRTSHWLCKCDCGNTANIRQSGLISWRKAKTRSCGCQMGMRPNSSSITAQLSIKGWARAKVRRFDEYITRAKQRGFAFDLTPELFEVITSKNCFYCGSVPASIAYRSTRYKYKDARQGADFIYNGIDRVDSSIGYTVDNVVPCCRKCNTAKNKYTQVEFLSWVDQIYRYQHPS